MTKLLELGQHYASNFIKPEVDDNPQKYSLDLYLDNDLGAVRLKSDNLPPASALWGRYWYRSGINVSMTKELQGIVTEVTNRVKLQDGDTWLDIACNDGTLLKAVSDNIKKVGIDPADDTYFAESSKVANVVQDYFSYSAWVRAGQGNMTAKIITCIAMFYDLTDPHPFINDLYKVLDDNGTLVLQMSYTPLMLQQLAFDNICHEHVYYYDLTSIQQLFKGHGFKVVDCQLNDTNGGSFRIYLQKEISYISSFATATLRDVCNARIQGTLMYEKYVCNIRSTQTWEHFNTRLQQLKTDVVSFVDNALTEGKTVYGYGASTKGNTLLQYFGLDHTKITAIAERSPYKFGLETIGTRIPIISEDEMRQQKPDNLLVLPWHFIDEFERREKEFLDNGGSLIVPCPTFKIIKG